MEIAKATIFVILSLHEYAVAYYDSLQVRQKTLENARLILQIDNSKLANEDFKNK